MTGSLRQAWEYTVAEVWEPLAAHASPPPDLFSDLLEAVDDYLAIATLEQTFEELRNDPGKARASFLALKGTDFASESDIVNFLEEARDVIADYDIPGYEELYKRFLRDLLRKYNLRYPWVSLLTSDSCSLARSPTSMLNCTGSTRLMPTSPSCWPSSNMPSTATLAPRTQPT